jgi:hypothetical protein
MIFVSTVLHFSLTHSVFAPTLGTADLDDMTFVK